ncbi:MAG TPA: tRNA epoxyqueuosine(34) reductase QueG [candidate division Zixibacteria bacterium]|nr:tRNA epoxyqueuosine(34) reductase QueG [candidate division Zixibacteria bacterium]
MKIDSSLIKQLAAACGFDLCGITRPDPIPEAIQRIHRWLDAGYHADMDWLKTSLSRRLDPRSLMDNVRSVIMLGLNYYQPNSEVIPPGKGRVARYARGRDYHKVLSKLCQELIARIEDELNRDAVLTNPPRFKFWVDYGPFMEKAYAEKAGLGYVGKHGLLINKQYGSWFFLAEIVTDLDLKPDQTWIGEHGRCGTCRRCIDACPTGAIVSDRVVDANRCLSYWTIETSDDIPFDIARTMNENVFGCDICQEVCPHNQHRAKPANHKEFKVEAGVGEFLDLERVSNMESDEEFLALTAGTPLTRPKLKGLVRNARIVVQNRTEE